MSKATVSFLVAMCYWVPVQFGIYMNWREEPQRTCNSDAEEDSWFFERWNGCAAFLL